MYKKISLCYRDQSSTFIDIDESEGKIQSGLDIVIADTFSEIVRTQQNIEDAEARSADKFFLAVTLREFLEELKRDAR